ncbi:MAG: peptidoglycan DD-metalloendopeptidase family protein [Alistipes sp.]|nr:peptidoglycan DD-metalloendopeptidase family protein [Alistipes sp.]
MRQLLLILLGTLLILATPSTLSAQNDKVERQRRVIANLEKSIAREERQLASLKKDKASTRKRVQLLTRQIEKRGALIRETNRQIRSLTAEVNATSRNIEELSGQLTALEKSTAEMVRTAYRTYRHNTPLAFIFAAQSATDMLRRIAMLRTATIARDKQMEQIVATRKDLQRERERLAAQRADLAATKAKLNKQRTSLSNDMKEAKRAINQLSKREKQVLQSKIEHEEKLDNAIKQLRKLTKGNKAGASFSAKTTALNLPVVGGKVKRYKGNMAEITGKEGAAIISIYEGKVVDVKRNKVSGKYDIYIAHGEYITSYANLSAAQVAKGTIVKKGQRIGTIGSAVNMTTMEMEYKIVFGIYAPSPDVKMSAANCFKK